MKIEIKDCLICTNHVNIRGYLKIKPYSFIMTTKVSESLSDILPGSVSKFTGSQLAAAFVRISKDPRVSKTTVPQDIQALRPDVRKMSSWKIDYKYNTVTGIGDLNKALVRIMCYSIRPHVKKVQTQSGVKNDAVVSELEKQLANLKSGTQTEQTAQLIETKTQMIEKLKAKSVQIVEEEKEEFTPEKMAAIAKRVYDILIDQNRAFTMHEEIEFLLRPKVDHVKEAMGGDYVLPNSDRDRRYKSDGNSGWRDHKTFQPSHGQSQTQGDRYGDRNQGYGSSRVDTIDNWRDKPRSVPGPGAGDQGKSKYFAPVPRDDVGHRDTGREQARGAEQSTESKPAKYVPPVFRSDQTNSSQVPPQKLDAQTDVAKKDTYVPPHLKAKMSAISTGPNRDPTDFSDPNEQPRSGNRFDKPYEPKYGRQEGRSDGRTEPYNRYGARDGPRDGGRYPYNRYDDRRGDDRRGDGRRVDDRQEAPRDATFVSIDKIQGIVDVSSVTDFPTLGGKTSSAHGSGTPQKSLKQEPKVNDVRPKAPATLLQVADDNDEYDYGAWDKEDDGNAKDHSTPNAESSALTQNGVKSFAAIAKEAAARPVGWGHAPVVKQVVKSKHVSATDWETIVDDEDTEESEDTLILATKQPPAPVKPQIVYASKLQPTDKTPASGLRPGLKAGPVLGLRSLAKFAATTATKKTFYGDSPRDEDDEDYDDWGETSNAVPNYNIQNLQDDEDYDGSAW